MRAYLMIDGKLFQRGHSVSHLCGLGAEIIASQHGLPVPSNERWSTTWNPALKDGNGDTRLYVAEFFPNYRVVVEKI